MDTVIKVGAIDDDQLLLSLAGHWFETIPDIELAHTAESVDEYLRLDADDDLVLLDLNLPDKSRPRDNVAKLVRHGYRVVVMSMIADKEYVLSTLHAGASDYLTKGSKSSDLATLLRTIRGVFRGSHIMSQELAFLIARDRRTTRPNLSDREQQVVNLYSKGMKLDAVASQLNITPGAARSYLQRARDKYSAVQRPFRNRTELIQRLREDSVDPPPPL